MIYYKRQKERTYEKKKEKNKKIVMLGCNSMAMCCDVVQLRNDMTVFYGDVVQLRNDMMVFYGDVVQPRYDMTVFYDDVWRCCIAAL